MKIISNYLGRREVRKRKSKRSRIQERGKEIRKTEASVTPLGRDSGAAAAVLPVLRQLISARGSSKENL